MKVGKIKIVSHDKIMKRYLKNGKELHTLDILKDDQQLTTQGKRLQLHVFKKNLDDGKTERKGEGAYSVLKSEDFTSCANLKQA